MTKIKLLGISALLSLFATTANAVPFTIEIDGTSGASAAWSVIGATSYAGTYGGPGYYIRGGHLADGHYVWGIIGKLNASYRRWTHAIAYRLTVGGKIVDQGYVQGRKWTKTIFIDGGKFTAVPEPATLALLGLGLAGLGFSTRRKARIS